MSFDRRDIRSGMDVYTLDNVYLGSVLSTTPGSAPTNREEVAATARVPSSKISGELLGPMPTTNIGNLGPERQAARSGYATQADAAPLGAGSLTVGKWWGLVGRRAIRLDLVQTVSLERVVLKLRARDLG